MAVFSFPDEIYYQTLTIYTNFFTFSFIPFVGHLFPAVNWIPHLLGSFFPEGILVIFAADKNTLMRYFLPLLVFTFLLGSCSKEKRQAKKEKKSIEKYISEKGWSASSTSSGLYYVIDDAGTGVNPDASSQVTVAYKGYLLDGTVFDESDVAGITFYLSKVIKGWREGIPLFKEGGKGKLLIPSAMAYGASQHKKIPPYSVLIFEVHLIDVL